MLEKSELAGWNLVELSVDVKTARFVKFYHFPSDGCDFPARNLTKLPLLDQKCHDMIWACDFFWTNGPETYGFLQKLKPILVDLEGRLPILHMANVDFPRLSRSSQSEFQDVALKDRKFEARAS